jgi:hypothetical protein
MQNEINKNIVEKLNLFHSKWDWISLSKNPKITWDIVKRNPDKPWHWRALTRNPIITMDIVEKYVVCRKRLLWEFLEEI